jgi:hypothetical protein
MKIKKSSVLIAAVVLVSIFAYYRYAKEVWPTTRQEDVLSKERMEESSATSLKEVRAEVSYTVPGDTVDHLRFVVMVDAQGTIQNIQTLDAETGKIPEKKQEFNDQVNVLLKGKKLAELKAIDKVGKSSLTTDAFNQALPELQSKL